MRMLASGLIFIKGFAGTEIVPVTEAQKAPFCITGDYARWKQVIKKELEAGERNDAGKAQAKRRPADHRTLCQSLPGTG